nr:tail fiber domain-containing protein [Enterobacter mori]
MIYTTGTITISGNTLTGTGTNFTAAGSLIRNGCTVIALTSPAQVFQITTIGSATSLTVTPAANPAIPAGTKYAILLSDSLSVDGLAQDIAETFTMYQRYMSGFADVMNGTTDVTITINGTAVTVPGQKSLAKKGANSDITSLSGLTSALSISQGGTGAKNAPDARTALSAAASGDNTDITSLSGIISPRGAINSRLNGGSIASLALGTAAGTAVKPFNLNVSRLGNASNNWNFQVTYGFLVGDDGSANSSGPIIVCCDGSSYERRWIFRNTDGAINTSNGTISPGASDERVKNIIREITEEEAVRIIQGLKPIRYSFKWSPEQIKVGYSAQNVEALDAELLSTTPLTIPDPEQPDNPMAGMTIEDGKVVDPGEIGAAYLVPVVQQLLRRVTELEKMLEKR